MKIQCFSLILLSLSLVGCDSFKWIYNYSDLMTNWQVDRYFDLSSDQEDLLSQRTAKFLEWHRREELPQYKSFVKHLKTRAKDGLSSSELDLIFSEAEAIRNRFFQKMLPEAASFLSSIKAEQVAYLKEQFHEESLELEEELKEPLAERYEEQQETFLDTLEDWLGSLSDQQEKQISVWHQEWFSNRPDMTAVRLERRKKQQPKFVALLKSEPSQKEAEQWLKKWLEGWTAPSDPVVKARRAKNIEENKQLILQIDSILTTKQRQHLTAQFDEYIEQLHELILSL